MIEITYREEQGYRLPNLLPPQEPPVHLGKYALLRREFLRQSRRATYMVLKTSGKLTSHLAEIEQTANDRIERMVEEMKKSQGVTEALKAADPMKWLGMMNHIQQTVEECILNDLIYN